MKFSSTLARLLWRGGFAAAVTALVLVACGGGTRVEDFHPERILSFGDENSVLVEAAPPPASAASVAARKYGVNALVSATAASGTTAAQPAYIDCRTYPLWIQQVAASFSLTFEACKGGATNATGRSYATLGAKAGDVQTQMSVFFAEGKSFGEKDLVTVMAGQNDVLELFHGYPANPLDTQLAAARERAKVLALAANSIATSGPAVLVMRIPNLDLSPLGQASTTTDEQRNVLRKLSEAFNVSLQLNLINDGHLIGLVYGDAEVNNMHDFAAAYGVSDVKNAWCAQAYQGTALVEDPSQLTNCLFSTTTATPSAAAVAASAASSPTSFLWSGAVMLGPNGQARLGTLASDRALNNPF